MNGLAAACAGFALGLAYYGWLWRSVNRLRLGRNKTYAWSSLTRVMLAGVAFTALVLWGGILAVLAGLCGMVLARWHLIRIVQGHK